MVIARPRYRVEQSTPASRVAAGVGLVILAVLAALPWLAERATLRLVMEMLTYLTLAQLWNLLAGYGGLVSIGQQAFIGLGGYALLALCVWCGLHPLLALPIAGAVTFAAAIPTAFIVFRLAGPYFAIGTWVVAEVYRLGFAQVSALGGGSGMSLPVAVVKGIARDAVTRDAYVYWTTLAIAVVTLAGIYLLLRARLGLAFTAIRDSAPAAESLGVDSYRSKLLIYLAVAAATGVVGALIAVQKLRLSPDASFSLNDWTAFVIFMTVIGGIGRIEGPIVGVLIFFAMRAAFADWGAIYLMMLGAVAVSVMLFAPRGLWGYVADRFDLHLFPVQRRLKLLDPAPAPVPRVAAMVGKA